jgi:hypothetical protein
MKLHSSPIDDVYGELSLTLEEDGGHLARCLLTLFCYEYRGLRLAMLLALRRHWRLAKETSAPTFPGYELFNLSPAEADAEWGQE